MMNGKRHVIDQSVVLELARRPQQSQQRFLGEADPGATRSARPDASVLIEAISKAASSIAISEDRVRELEQAKREYEDLVERMKSKLGEMLSLQHQTDAQAKAEAERAMRAEAQVERLQTRVQILEADLEATLADLHRIADVITGSLLLTN